MTSEGSPLPFGQDPRDRVERTFHPNGKLKSEIHYRGITEHGPYRTWHPDGTLAEEYFFEIGAYRDGVMRSWHANGKLSTESRYVNFEEVGRMRIFNEDGSEFKYAEPFFRKRTRKRKPAKPRPRPSDADIERHEAFIKDRLNAPRAEALAWLRSGPENSRNLGEFDPSESVELVEIIYGLGAVEVIAVDIGTSMGRDFESSNELVVRLPPDPAKRASLFEFHGRQARSVGFESEPDWGQSCIYMLLC